MNTEQNSQNSTEARNDGNTVLAEVLNGYIETLKASLKNAIENQEQENRVEFNAGREDAFSYALEMLDKHFC